MRALLLAAGLGTRMQPLTSLLPKCLAPIHGRPLLDYWLETLLNHGVAEILVNTHYMEPMVRKFISQSTWCPRIKLVHEECLLGTGGTILKNRDFFGEQAFLVAHADNLTIFDAADFANSHANRPARAELSMMVFETPDPKSCGIVELDKLGVVQAFHEKVPCPPGKLANAAVYILEPTVVDRMAVLGKDQIDLSTEVLPNMLGKMYSYHNTAYHRDIGTLNSWMEANQDFPPMPAAEQNSRAWASITGCGGGDLLRKIERFIISK